MLSGQFYYVSGMRTKERMAISALQMNLVKSGWH